LARAAALVALPLTGHAQLRPDPTPAATADPAFDVIVLSDIMVPMRDGIRLATDVYLPARDGKPVARRFPVILERTPYGKTTDSRSERTPQTAKPKSRAEVAAFFVRRGYVVIYRTAAAATWWVAHSISARRSSSLAPGHRIDRSPSVPMSWFSRPRPSPKTSK